MHDDDMSSMFRAHHLRRQAKRASNLEYSTQRLVDEGIGFTSHNQGTHLIVLKKWDFWPSTGRFIERKGRSGHAKRDGRGIERLLKMIREDAGQVDLFGGEDGS